jgi:hypothetical protein
MQQCGAVRRDAWEQRTAAATMGVVSVDRLFLLQHTLKRPDIDPEPNHQIHQHHQIQQHYQIHQHHQSSWRIQEHNSIDCLRLMPAFRLSLEALR